MLQIELYPFTKKFFRKTFVQYVTVWLVRIWTHKNADEKAHTLSRRSKNVKKRTKRTKNGYCVNSPLALLFTLGYLVVFLWVVVGVFLYFEQKWLFALLILVHAA